MNFPALAALFGVALVVAIAGFIVLTSYNAIVALRQRIDKAWSNIDVVLKQRHDQLPNLVAAVRGVMAFERDVLTEVTRARAAYSPTAPIPDQAVTSEATSSAVRSLFAVVERYPDLKSQGNVQDLQDEIERLEGMIADRRELYNDQVYRYNTAIVQVPGVLLASLCGWKTRQFFAAEPEAGVRPDARSRHIVTRTDPGSRELWLVRHGETEWARLGRHTGRTDVPLTDLGRDQARALGRRLAGHAFGLVLSSPLSRARDTASLAGFGDVAVDDPDLMEWDYGSLEGRRTAEILADYPGWTIWQGPWPGGENIEQVAARADRIVARVRSAGPGATSSSLHTDTSSASSALAGWAFRPLLAGCSRWTPPRSPSWAGNTTLPSSRPGTKRARPPEARRRSASARLLRSWSTRSLPRTRGGEHRQPGLLAGRTARSPRRP